MIDGVRSRQRVNVHACIAKRLTHAREGARTICKKDCQLGGCIDGKLGMCVHADSKLMPRMASDNSELPDV